MSNYKWNEIETPGWEPVSFAASCSHDNEIYLSGGWNPLTNSFNAQFWKMDEHKLWENLKRTPIWSPRNGHTLTEFNGDLWLIGGFNYESRYLEDIWKLDPSDMEHGWKCVSQRNSWEGREGHSTIVYKNSLWILGGIASSGVKNDIWTSKDGITWEGDFETPPWCGRCFHSVISFNGKLWLIAGSAQKSAMKDMYVSTNGHEWELFDENLPFTPRFGSGTCIYDDKIWFVGGSDGKEKAFNNEVWTFSEEEEWRKFPVQSPWSPRWAFNTTLNYKNSLILLCGGVRFPDRKYSAYVDGWVLEKEKL